MISKNGPLKPAGTGRSLVPARHRERKPVPEHRSPSFQDLLEKTQARKESLTFSAHARERLESRQIRLDKSDLDKLSVAMEKAGQKGACSALLLYGTLAMVTSVPNRTVITAVDTAGTGEQQIFTNIDSAVIIG